MENVLLLLARSLGFFVFSPLFKFPLFPPFIRLGLAVTSSLLLAPGLKSNVTLSSSLVLSIFAQGLIGYLLGFIFSLIFQAIALAGEVLGTMMGLSPADLFQPLLSPTSPLMSKLFTLLSLTLFFALDLHHVVLKTLFENPYFDANIIKNISILSSHLFYHALQFAAFPFMVLVVVLLVLGLSSRMFPEMPILWMGFPLQLLTGFVALFFAFKAFPQSLMLFFHEISHFIDRILKPLI